MRRSTVTTTVLALTVEHGGSRTDVSVDLPAGASVGAMARALVLAFPELPPAVDLRVARTGEVLPPSAVVLDRDVRSGDTLRATPGIRRSAAGDGAPEPLVGIRRRTSREAEPDVILGGTIRLRSTRLRRASPPTVYRAAGPVVASLRTRGASIDIPTGEHAIAVDHAGAPYLTSASAAALFGVRAQPGGLAVLALPDGPELSVDGALAGHDWIELATGSQLRCAALRLSASVAPAEPRGRHERLVVGDTADTRTRVDLGTGGAVQVHRPPRRVSTWRPSDVQLPQTPRPATPLRLPLVAAVVPLLAGLVLFAVSGQAMMLAFMLLSPVMMVGTYVTDRRGRAKDRATEAAQFEQRIDHAYHELVRTLGTEADERREAAPPVATLMYWARALDQRLWERRPWDADFLTLRIGLGDLPAIGAAKLPQHSDTEPDPRLRELTDAARVLADVPATVPLGGRPVLGLAGARPVTSALARALVIQSAVLHSPLELGIVAALPPGGESGWEWLKWLPHVQTAAGVIGQSPLATGRDAVDVLRAIRETRSAPADGRADAPAAAPALLVLIDEQLQLDRALASELLGAARQHGLAVIWIGHDPRSLPGECQTIVDAQADGTADVLGVEDGSRASGVRIEGSTLDEAHEVARSLAPARDVTHASANARVPQRVKLLDQLGLAVPTGEHLAERWQRRPKGLSAEIGMGAGVPVEVDLRSDGPHALIAGTTGSGKSELLRTFVASLAASHPPHRLTFLLIDYKGGAAFAPCAGLPHVLDVVSDLDAELGERALVSLGAEMRRRERLLAEHRADNLIDLERRAPDAAPPNLVIMVDEFAKLRDEIPEFIDGVVDVAQRGRTLGIHMVLAAQSLRNAFTPAVRANTNLRIALRVTSDSESQDVIDASDAARISSDVALRGRAFARIGHERLMEFQCAHVSGRFVPPGEQEVLARPFGFGDLAVPALRRGQDEEATPGSEETDLAALRRAATAAADILGLPPQRPTWMPPLPPRLPRAAIQHATDAAAGRIALGLIDEPAQQRQVPLVLDLDRGNVAIYGMGGSGKTTALLSLALSACWDISPSALEVHAIDGGGGPLALLEALPHVSSVIGLSDSERVERLIERLEREVRRRSEPVARVGATSLTEYLAREDAEPFARIIVLLDGFGEFGNLYDTARPDSLFDRLVGLLGAGRGVGVHLVVTADRRGAVRSALGAALPQRILLRQASTDDLVAFGVPAKVADRVDLADGRAFTEGNLLAQIAMPAPELEGDDLALGLRRMAAHLTAAWPGARAREIATLPELVSRGALTKTGSASALPLGLGGADLGTASVDLSERHFLISGSYRTGRSTALATLAAGLLESVEIDRVHLIAPRRSPLLELAGWSSVAQGMTAASERCAEFARDVLERPEEPAPREVILIDDAGELQDPQLLVALERVVRIGRDRGLRIVAASETSAARMLGNLWLRELRRDQHGLLLMPDLIADGDLLAATLPRRTNVALSPGRGYLVAGGTAQLIQVASDR